MNRFIAKKVEIYKEKLIVINSNKCRVFNQIYKFANDYYEEWWHYCGLLLDDNIDNEEFCEWLNSKKPLTYQNAKNMADCQKLILDRQDISVILSFATEGEVGSCSVNKHLTGALDISSEYTLSKGINAKIEEERQVELISEYAANTPYLLQAYNYKFNQIDIEINNNELDNEIFNDEVNNEEKNKNVWEYDDEYIFDDDDYDDDDDDC